MQRDIMNRVHKPSPPPPSLFFYIYIYIYICIDLSKDGTGGLAVADSRWETISKSKGRCHNLFS